MQTIGDVLEACGNNIDVAIKQLGQLRLTARAGAAPVQPATDIATANLTQASANSQAAGSASLSASSISLQLLLISLSTCGVHSLDVTSRIQ